MSDKIKRECPRREKINTSEWIDAMVKYQKCKYCITVYDV